MSVRLVSTNSGVVEFRFVGVLLVGVANVVVENSNRFEVVSSNSFFFILFFLVM